MCFITLVLVVWFKTNAFVEYINLFKLGGYFKVGEYTKLDTGLSYPDFLKEFYNSFFTRLISCPICTATWLGIFSSALFGVVFINSTIFALFFYLLISKLM